MTALPVGSPVSGTVIPMNDVPDPVFADSMVGPGVAVVPDRAGDAVSPVDGTVATLHPHAFVITTASGRAVLVHLGIDTVKMGGEGFTLHVAKGDAVRAGQPVVRWDPDTVMAAGYSAVCPVVALDATAEALTSVHGPGSVAPVERLFTWV